MKIIHNYTKLSEKGSIYRFKSKQTIKKKEKILKANKENKNLYFTYH